MLIFSKDTNFLDAGTFTVPDHISDHSATYITLPFQYEPKSPFKRTVWLYNHADYNALNAKVSEFDWSCLSHGSVNEASNLFNDIFVEMVKSCIPSKLVTVRSDDKPWYNSEIRKTSRKRDRIKSKALKTGKISDWNSYKEFRNKVNNQKKQAKELFYNKLELTISDFQKNDKRKFWQVIRHFVKNENSTSTIPPLCSVSHSGEKQFHFSDEEKAECLNDYFSSISNVDDRNTVLPPFYCKSRNFLSNVSCTENEIELLIQTLNPNKANGLDGISNRMLKSVSKTISKPLAILLNRSFAEGIFPKIWKMSGLVPIPKKGDKSSPSNYRPIALLSNLSKIQERIAFKNLYNHLLDNNLLYKYQSGFLPQHSTVFQLVDIYHNICQSLTLSYNGQWTDHINNIKSSAAKVLGIMRKLKFSLSRSALNQIYFSYLLPTLEYASSVWDGCTAQNADILNKVQNEAARIVTGLTRSVSLDKLFKECGWLSLLERRRQQKLNFML